VEGRPTGRREGPTLIRFEKRDLSSRESHVHASRMSVRFQDVDAAGIVFFARYFDYVHLAYEEFLAKNGNRLAEVLREGRWAAPLKHAEADFLSPLRFGDELEVQLVAANAASSDLSLGWCLRKVSTGKPVTVCGVAQSVHTFVDVPSFEKRSIPDELLSALSEIL